MFSVDLPSPGLLLAFLPLLHVSTVVTTSTITVSVVSSCENIPLNSSFVYSTLVIHDILECNMEIVLLFAAFYSSAAHAQTAYSIFFFFNCSFAPSPPFSFFVSRI